MIDLYCERLGPGPLAEPINAITNLTFLVAALAAWSEAHQKELLTAENWMLISLMVYIVFRVLLMNTPVASRS